MFIHFDLPCDGEKQTKLHRVFRLKIREWKKAGLVNRVVLTYHYHTPSVPSDSLYVCLELPALVEAAASEVQVSQEIMEQIPSHVVEYFEHVRQEESITYRVTNYWAEIEHNKRSSEQTGQSYYDGAPVEEIVRFASIGTEIAMEVLDLLETGGASWCQDSELSDFILMRLGHELGSNYRWMDLALHFVCNPLRLPEDLIVMTHMGGIALDFVKRGLHE